MEPEVAFVEEIEAGGRLLGRFAARHLGAWAGRGRPELARIDDVPVDEAIAWSRERTGLVLVRFGRRTGYWSAGRTPHWSYPSWPPHDLPPLVERIAVDERAPEAARHWAVTFWLRPPDEARDRWDPVVAACAAQARLGWDAHCLAEYLRARGSSLVMWPPAYRVYAVEHAETAEAAERQAAARIALPEGFKSWITVRPADLTEGEG
jgi:hypothetical protein